MYAGLNGVPVNDGGNGATAANLDPVEFARGSPLPGYEDIPLRMDSFLSAHSSGAPIGPYGDGRNCSHTITNEGWDILKRINDKSGMTKVMEAMNCDDLTDDIFYQIMTEPATNAVNQESFRMTQQYLHKGIDPTVSTEDEERSKVSARHHDSLSEPARDQEHGKEVPDAEACSKNSCLDKISSGE